jgi:hypothetical protein
MCVVFMIAIATGNSFSMNKQSTSTILSLSSTRASMKLQAFPNLQTFFIAEGGLDAETLESLGDLQELNDALDGAIDAANPAVGILSKLVASPAFLAIPIGAGIAVSFIIGYFIFSYGQGKDD